MPNYRNNTFANVADINRFFAKLGAKDFPDWFNRKMAGRDNWGGKRIENPTNWSLVWSHPELLIGKSTFNLIEFLALNSIILNETGGTFKPISEIIGSEGHPGISYAFDKISGKKRSYNDPTDGVGNRTAYDLFRDSIYKDAHVTKPFGSVLKDTTNVAWRGRTFPTGFSGNVNSEVDKTGKTNTFLTESDFYKFRGRGYIQTTSRAGYKPIVKFVLSYTGSNQTIIRIKSEWSKYNGNLESICSASTNQQWDDLFQNTNSIVADHAVWVHSLERGKYSWIDSNLSSGDLQNRIISMGKKVSGGEKYAKLFYSRVMQQLNLIESSEAGGVVVAEPGPTNYQDSPNPEDSRLERTGEDPNQGVGAENRNSAGKFQTLVNVIPTKIKPDPIRMNTPPQKDVQSEISQGLGNLPFVWYNNYQIELPDITFFQLYINNNLPTLKLVFRDTLNLMRDRAFPLDDTKIQIFLNPRSQQLKPIFLQLKIVNFSFDGPNLSLSAIIDVNPLYNKRFKSYSNMTSYKVFEDFCKETGMGLNTNIDDTNDAMTWINPGQRNLDFLNTVMDSSYSSDQTFLLYYVDYYYNLNFVDIEKELNRDIKEELGVSNIGIEEVAKIDDKERTSRLFLTNDASMENSNSYFKRYRVINNSTKISIQEGYLSRVKFYDELSKDFLIFDVDSITSRGDKSIILKGAPQDESFFKENTQVIYAGKLDTDNMHSNYQYSSIQNSRNVVELQKVCIEVEMSSPNYNIYRYQKMFVFVSNQASTPSASHVNNRLTGEWFVIDIRYVFDGISFKQVIRLIKRELDLSPEEAQLEAEQNPNPEPGQNTSNDNSVEERSPNPSTVGTEEVPVTFAVDNIKPADSQSEIYISDLVPEVQSLARQLVSKAAAAGIEIRITRGLVTYDQQKSLAESGGEQPGYSVYNFGMAFDVGVFVGESYQSVSPMYDKLGVIGISMGLFWGGNLDNKKSYLYELKPLWSKNLSQEEYVSGLRKRKSTNSSYLK
jgi:hypothetical protein